MFFAVQDFAGYRENRLTTLFFVPFFSAKIGNTLRNGSERSPARNSLRRICARSARTEHAWRASPTAVRRLRQILLRLRRRSVLRAGALHSRSSRVPDYLQHHTPRPAIPRPWPQE